MNGEQRRRLYLALMIRADEHEQQCLKLETQLSELLLDEQLGSTKMMSAMRMSARASECRDIARIVRDFK